MIKSELLYQPAYALARVSMTSSETPRSRKEGMEALKVANQHVLEHGEPA